MITKKPVLANVLAGMDKKELVLVKAILDNVDEIKSPKNYPEHLQGYISPATISWNAIDNVVKEMYDGNVSQLGVSERIKEYNDALSFLENQFREGNYSFVSNLHKIFQSLNVSKDKKDDSNVYLIEDIDFQKREITKQISTILNKSKTLDDFF
jgi:hypothetical protein